VGAATLKNVIVVAGRSIILTKIPAVPKIIAANITSKYGLNDII
jgi:hypothetical protein